MKKKDIRDIFNEKRLQLNIEQIKKLNDQLLLQFQKLPIDIPALIMTYYPMKRLNEFDPQLVTDYCYFKNPGQQLSYPVIVEQGEKVEITAMVADDESLFETNKYGIDEPVDGIDMFSSEIDMIIVPLLSFDKKGNCVGYGQGYYDRFLKLCRKDCLKIGFSYFDCIEKIDDINKYDVKLNYCITPDRIFEF